MKKFPIAAHLDLKGVQYRHDYYEEYFQNLSRLGYDAVLVEYEDVFPFQSVSLSRYPEELWSPEFLQHFLKLASDAGIEVIPLQQCLGHMEYVFRQPAYRKFSIPGKEPRDLQIALPEAREWFRKMLKEVLAAHTDSRYIHLGMDEARSFAAYARGEGKDPLDMFLEYLEELCGICAEFGKTPLIWSDMLEDHIAPENIERLKALREKVILVPWNYFAGIKPEGMVRFSGLRCSRKWLEEPEGGPSDVNLFPDGLLHFEDWAPEIKELTAEFQVSPWLMEPLFQAAIWKRLGFRVWGGAGGSITQDRSILPYYNWRSANIQLWKETIERYQLDGLIITHWARSNSCTVPNINPDAVWPILAKAVSPDNSCKTFFPDAEQVDRIFFQIGKCREEWNIEKSLIQEMKQIKVSEHAFEWKTITLLLEVLYIHKCLLSREEQCSCFAGIGRMSEIGWKEHSDILAQIEPELSSLQDQVREHLEKRYFGHALEEWFYKIFTTSQELIDRLKITIEESKAKYSKMR